MREDKEMLFRKFIPSSCIWEHNIGIYAKTTRKN
jgi:hypothetical protein